MLLLSDFALHRPTTLDDALALRAELGEDAALYAGGTELLLGMKMGVLEYEHLIDLKRVGALGGIERRNGTLRIGAAATHREIETSPEVAAVVPALTELERNVANVRVRAAGTLGGNLAFAEPHADPPALLVAVGASVELTGGGGERSLRVEEFLAGAYETALGEDELIAAITVPVPEEGVRTAYRKFQVLERPAVGVAAAGTVRDGVWQDAPVVVVGAVDERPLRVPAGALTDCECDDEAAMSEVVAAASEIVDPVSDLSGSADYKRHLVGVLVRRVLTGLGTGGGEK